MSFAAKQLVIDLTPSRVRVSAAPDRFVEVAPVIYLASDRTTPHVIAVGDTDPVTRPAIRVQLLNLEAPPQGVSKALCLTLFFRFLIATVAPPGLISLKPAVIVRGARSLTSLLAGYERDLLIQTLKDAGARSVVFQDDGATL